MAISNPPRGGGGGASLSGGSVVEPTAGLNGMVFDVPPNAHSGVVVNNHSDSAPGAIFDTTGDQACIRTRITEDPDADPGSHGTGDHWQLFGYSGLTTLTNGSISNGSAAFGDSTAHFTSADVNKAFTVEAAGPGMSNLVTTIAAVTSATTVTLADAASQDVFGGNSFYQSSENSILAGRIDANMRFVAVGDKPFTFKSEGAIPALAITRDDVSGSGSGAAIGLDVMQHGNDPTARFRWTGSSDGVQIDGSQGTGGSFVYPLKVTGLSSGVSITVSQDNGTALLVSKASNNGGTALKISSRGTGAIALDVQAGTGGFVQTALQVVSTGHLKFSRSALQGASAPADPVTPAGYQQIKLADDSVVKVPYFV